MLFDRGNNISRWNLGLIFIVLVASLWTLGSITTQYIYEHMEFESPFIMNYVSTSMFSLYMPVWTLLRFRKGESINAVDKESKYSHMDVFLSSCILAVLWFVGNCLYEYSLFWTTIASSTIISNLSGSFTFMMSYAVGIESFSWGKLLGVLICFAGVVMVTFNDKENDDDSSGDSFRGDVMALLSALAYGAYTTYLRYRFPINSHVSMQLVLGYMGIVCALLFLPLLFVVIYCHIDDTSNFTGTILLYLLGTGFFDYVISDYLWAKAVLLTTPTVATVGLSVTIPLAFVADILLHGTDSQSYSALSIVGTLAVLLGFIMINVIGSSEQDESVNYVAVADDDTNNEKEHLQRPLLTP